MSRNEFWVWLDENYRGIEYVIFCKPMVMTREWGVYVSEKPQSFESRYAIASVHRKKTKAESEAVKYQRWLQKWEASNG
jgi:hypothetical protein